MTNKYNFKNKTYCVEILEYERGWGRRVDETLYFQTKEEAEKFVLEYNSENPAGPAPDWYMIANYVG